MFPPGFSDKSIRAMEEPLHRTRYDRRTILKAAAGGAILLLSGKAFPRPASAGIPDRGAAGRLSLFNTHTGERLSVACPDGPEGHDPKTVSALNRILRCHYTQQVAEMDLRVIGFLSAVDKSLGGGNEIHIVSGFRSPEYNEKLVRQGQGVARHSLHLQGKAIDVRIPGIGLPTVRETALRLQEGGVGYYPGSGFVHIDSGRFRAW